MQPHLLAALTMDDLGRYEFRPRTALKLLSLDVAANQYLTAYRARAMPETVEPTPEHLCVVRHQNEVRRLNMQAPEYALLAFLLEGVAFGTPLGQSHARISEGSLMSPIACWLNNGAFQQ